MKNGLIYLIENGLLTQKRDSLKLFYDFSKTGDFYSFSSNSRKIIRSLVGENDVVISESGRNFQNFTVNQTENIFTGNYSLESGQRYKLLLDCSSISDGGRFSPFFNTTALGLVNVLDKYYFDFTSNNSNINPLKFRCVSSSASMTYENVSLERVNETDAYFKNYIGNINTLTYVESNRYTNVLKDGSVNLLGNSISQNSGQNAFLQINNTGQFYNRTGFSFIVEGGKIPRDEIKSIYPNTGYDEQLPLHNKEIIFSNISGSGIDYKGFEFGLNGANLFYFRTSDLGQQKVCTFDLETPYAENIWVLRYLEKDIYISRYSKEQNSITSKTIKLGSDLTNGGYWYLNSGQNSDLAALNTGLAQNATSSTKLRRFLFFDEFLSDGQLVKAVDFLNKTVDESGTPYISNSGFNYQVTGTQEFVYVKTGVLYLTGIPTQEEIILTGDHGTNIYSSITGQVQKYGGKIFEESFTGEGIYLDDFVFSDSGETGITNFSFEYSPYQQTEYRNIFVMSGITGELFRTSYFTNLYGNSYFETTGYKTGVSINEVDYYNRPKSMTYRGKRDANNIEIYLSNQVYSGNEKIANKECQGIFSSYNDGRTLYLGLLDTGNASNIILFKNGFAQKMGVGEPKTVTINGIEYPYFNITGGDYSIANGQEIFFGQDITGELNGVYDIKPMNGYQELLITGLNQYDIEIFGDIQPSGKDVFFNGLKIYEGLNYEIELNDIKPIGYLTGQTGLYRAWNNTNGALLYTGNSVYDYYGTGLIEKDSLVVWMNGLRKTPSEFIYHDINVDLITGVDSMVDGTGVFEGYLEV